MTNNSKSKFLFQFFIVHFQLTQAKIKTYIVSLFLRLNCLDKNVKMIQ